MIPSLPLRVLTRVLPGSDTIEGLMELLFSYGTLQHEDVQLANFGRRLEGQPDALIGYRLITTQVRDPDFASVNGATQRTVEFTGIASDSVNGMVFRLTKEEIEYADKYEPADYQRVSVELKSGVRTWVYLQQDRLLNGERICE